ncbi:hypothetical protein [Bradyrhizobium monzae]|uniref:hypothetical protein n=1 Tax=Bradyrhizobium sp. Oc8 TaxID=2876780 RepID=UPI001F24D319|nr:hypothetical protein [Bradyrhizobium sp. Oc8]
MNEIAVLVFGLGRIFDRSFPRVSRSLSFGTGPGRLREVFCVMVFCVMADPPDRSTLALRLRSLDTSGKLLVWDKVLGLGSTDPLAGFAAITANLVVSFYFAKRGFENVARIIKR